MYFSIAVLSSERKKFYIVYLTNIIERKKVRGDGISYGMEEACLSG